MARLVDRMTKKLQEGLQVVKKGAAIVAKKTPEVAAAVAEKTHEAVNVGKITLHIQSLNRALDKNFMELGKSVYSLSKKKVQRVESYEKVQKTIKTADALKKEIRGLEKKIKELKK